MFGYFYTCIRYTCVYCTSVFFCIGINKASIVFRGIETDMKLDIRQFLISVLVIGSMIIDVKKQQITFQIKNAESYTCIR